jgi:hypothetical protein
MTPKEKAEDLINSYRIILMNEDTECGNEILCTSIAKQCALIAVEEIETVLLQERVFESLDYWQEVKQEIELL